MPNIMTNKLEVKDEHPRWGVDRAGLSIYLEERKWFNATFMETKARRVEECIVDFDLS